MSFKVLKVSDLYQCELCLNSFEKLQEFQCLEVTLKICKYCFSQLKIIRRNHFYIEINSCLVIVKYNSTQYYKLQYTKCQICQQNKICSKMCMKEHFFCFHCTQDYFEANLKQQFIKCAMLKCDQQIDYQIIALFIQKEKIEEWSKINPINFCANILCENEIKFSRQCVMSSVNHRFCNKEKVSKPINFINNYLNRMTNKFNILQCPKCECQSYYTKLESTKQCHICLTQFCSVCKSCEEQLFTQKNLQHRYCQHCQRRVQMKTLFLKICFPVWIPLSLVYVILLIVLFLTLVLFFQVTRLTDFFKKKWQNWNFKYKKWIFYLLFPLMIILQIINIFLNYGTKLLQYIFHRMTLQQQESNPPLLLRKSEMRIQAQQQ